jgi:hypothetical protein
VEDAVISTLEKIIPGLFSGLGSIHGLLFLLHKVCEMGLKIIAEIGFLLVADPFGLRFGTLMISILVIKATVKTAFQGITTLRTEGLARNLIRYLNLIFTVPADYCIQHI